MTVGFHLEGAIHGPEIRAGEIGKALNRITTRNLEIGIETEMRPSPENRVTLDTKAKDYFGNPGTNLFVSETEEDVRTAARGKKLARKIYADLGAKEIEELPSSKWAHHHMGTCRMGDNPLN